MKHHKLTKYFQRKWLEITTSFSHPVQKYGLLLTLVFIFTLSVFILTVVLNAGNLVLREEEFNFKPELMLYPKNDVFCYCNNENFCFQGLNENGSTINGRKFDCSLYEGLKLNGLLDSDALNTPSDYKMLNDTWKPVFVTSMSDNHFRESRKLIKSINKYYPHSKIVVFDLGLKLEYVEEVKAWCNVEYKTFNFDQYPHHVQTLTTYAFKMLLIEIIKEYKTFFYFDSSVRIKSKNLNYFLQGVKSRIFLPFSIHSYADHSVFSTTNERMFAYLPLPKIISQIKEIQSTFMFVSDSPYTRYIFKWWYLCAMTKDCIAPEDAKVNCVVDNYNDRMRTFMDCHRFDQSVWNILNLVYLFGHKRGALELGYAKEDWTQLDENLVAQVEIARNSSMKFFFNMVNINRVSKMNNRLKLKCKT